MTDTAQPGEEREFSDLLAFLEDDEPELYAAPVRPAAQPAEDEAALPDIPVSAPEQSAAGDEEALLVSEWDSILSAGEGDDEPASSDSYVSGTRDEVPQEITGWDWDEDLDDDEEEDGPGGDDDIFPEGEEELAAFAAPLSRNSAADAGPREEPAGTTTGSTGTPGDRIADRLRQAFASFRNQVAAELRGGDEAPVRQESGEEDETRHRRRSGSFSSGYRRLSAALFRPIGWLLGLLGSLPLIGRYVRMFLAAQRAVSIVSGLLLPVILSASSMLAYDRAVPADVTSEIPDGGLVVIDSFSLDKDRKVASGVIRNNGDVIASVSPEFKVHVSSPVKPWTFFWPELAATCTGDEVKVDMESSLAVSANCPVLPDSGILRVSGTVTSY